MVYKYSYLDLPGIQNIQKYQAYPEIEDHDEPDPDDPDPESFVPPEKDTSRYQK